jgi:hypothetical protein
MFGAAAVVRQCRPTLPRRRAACSYQAASSSAFGNSGGEGPGRKALASANGELHPGFSLHRVRYASRLRASFGGSRAVGAAV